MQARFIRLEWENAARTIGSFYFKPDKPYYFTPGQYTDITITHALADSRGALRTMTISSKPSDNLLCFATRFSPRGISTYKKTLLGLSTGDVVTLTDAMGDMVLPLDTTIPLVFVAGGVGIASYISMILWLAEQQDKRDITLLYTVRNTDDIIFQNQFDAYDRVGSLKRILYTTDNKSPGTSWNGTVVQARLTSEDIIAAMKPDAQVYLSGAEAMVEQLRGELERTHKMPQYRIVFDFFDGYSSEI